MLENGLNTNFELSITGFNSKKIFVLGDGLAPRTLPYTNAPIFIEDVIALVGLVNIPGADVKIRVLRKGEKYIFSLMNTIKKSSSKFRLFPNDKVFISPLNYRKENVLVVGESGTQRAVQINSVERPTLSDTIFSGSVLNNVTSDFSQVYVLRKKRSQYSAYHLDITNPARISLSNQFEMRPDDIVFIATQPWSLYSRALSQILGSTGLTIQARDTLRTEIGN